MRILQGGLMFDHRESFKIQSIETPMTLRKRSAGPGRLASACDDDLWEEFGR
jgi:hypothetical protein